MSDAKKLPSGKWRNLLYVGKDENGKRKYESFTADTKREANLLAMARARELEQGIIKDRTPAEMTVGEVIDRYLSERDAVLKPKTIREYKRYRRLYMQEIMNVKLKNLTLSVVQREINRESARLSPKSIKNIWVFVQGAITTAMPDMRFDVNLPKLVKKEIVIPTNAQLDELLKTIKGSRLEIPVILGSVCGMRRGEISALDLNTDVDYERNRISITKAMTNTENSEWIIDTTKTYHSTRVVDAPQWVIDKLREARDSGYRAMNPAHITSAFRRISKRLGISVRFHDLRHYHASVMLMLGVPDKWAMQRMGHSTTHMLKTVYQHLMEDKISEYAETTNNYFDFMQHDMQHEDSESSETPTK